MGGAAGRPVSLHGVDGVNNGELGAYRLCKFQKHPGKIMKIRPEVVHLRLFQSRDNAEKIFDASRVAGHGMGFQLTDIDYIVRLQYGSDNMEGMVGKALRAGNRPGGEIHIQFKIWRQLLYAADIVDIFHIFCVIKPSRAFRKGDIPDPMSVQPPDHSFDYQRMGGDGKFRFFSHNQIRLYDYF